MTFRPWRRNDQVAYNPFAVRFLNCVLGVLANRKNWRFGRHQFSISDLKKNVTWAQPRSVCGAAFVNVLKHPTLFPVDFVPHESCSDGMATGDLRALGVAKTGVARLQLAQQILYLLFE